MRQYRNNFITLQPSFLILLAFCLIFLPINWFLGWLLAATVHEFSHIIAIKILRVQVYEVIVRSNGALIRTGPMSPATELVCVIAGPVGALSLLLFSKHLPYAAVCALMQTAFNLLPIYPLDGGRALKCFFKLLKVEKFAHKSIYYLNIVMTIALLILVSYAMVKRFRLLFLILFIILIQQICSLKITCK